MENPTIEAEFKEQSGYHVTPTTEALAVRQPQAVAPGLFGTQEPAVVIERAKIVAQALKDVIVKQGLVSKIQGKEYPRCEAWTLLGTMLGVFPVLCWSRPVDGGWEARVEARTKDGSIVGAAEAQCLKSERNWSNRDDFALRSMAQTRATAKCLRMPLGFVMSLSGFEPTPAEEMVADHPHKEWKVEPKAAPFTKVAPQPPRAPTTPKPVPFPTVESRQKMIAALKAGPGEPNREFVMEYFTKLTWLAPFEKQLEDLELRYVPATTGQMRDLSEKLSAFGNGEEISAPYAPHDEPENPKEEEPFPDTPFLKGKIANVSLKEGKSKQGPWSLWGIKIGEEWVNSFSNTIGQMAQVHKGEQVTLYYEEGEKGKKAVELILADGTRHRTEDRKGE